MARKCKLQINVIETSKDNIFIENATRIVIKNAGVGTIGFSTSTSNSFFPLEENEKEVIVQNDTIPSDYNINIKYESSSNKKVIFIINSI